MQTSMYEIQELVNLTGVPRRNIYFYVQQGLLPPPVGAGLAARYTEEHLLRLRLLPLLRRKGLKLDQIREQMAALSSTELQKLLEREAGQGVEPPKVRGPGRCIPAGQAVTRYDLPGGMVLLVPAELTPSHLDLFEELLAAAAKFEG